MKIADPCVVALTWELQDAQGEVLDVLPQPVEFLVGGQDLLASVERVLHGHGAGEKVSAYLQPEDAFGDYNSALVFLQPRSVFPAQLEEGMMFEASALPAGCSAVAADMVYTVSEIYPEHVVLDGNHPLAGMALHLHATIVHVRAATQEELARGSVGSGFFRVAPDQGPGGLH